MTETDILRILSEKYAEPEYIVLTHVRSATGFQDLQPRTADAMICSCWPSRGHEIWGVEVKVSRSDFLAEIKNPEKAEKIALKAIRNDGGVATRYRGGYWQLMGIDGTPSWEEVMDRYRQLAKKRHPDCGGSNESMAELLRAFDEARMELDG